jgi:hypothetical protein
MDPSTAHTHVDNALLFDPVDPDISAPPVVGFPALFPPGTASAGHGANFGILDEYLNRGEYDLTLS